MTRSAVALAAVVVVVLVLLVAFDRGPARISRRGDGSAVYSPAFGKVIRVSESGESVVVSVFLGLTDIHRQYFPVSGEVVSVVFDDTGKYEIASSAGKSDENVKMIHAVATSRGDVIKVTQIAGMLARTICAEKKAGDSVKSGELLGKIRLGSRVDIEYPREFGCLVREGDRVTAETVVAYM
jgi:phosphatidylserine decarboxylase